MKTINPKPNKHIDNNIGMRVQSMMMFIIFILTSNRSLPLRKSIKLLTITIKCSLKYYNRHIKIQVCTTALWL